MNTQNTYKIITTLGVATIITDSKSLASIIDLLKCNNERIEIYKFEPADTWNNESKFVLIHSIGLETN